MAKKNSKLMIVFAAIALAAYGCRQFTSNETADTTNATTRSAESGHAGKAAQGTAPAGNRDQEAYECPRWVRTGTAEQMLNRMAYTVSYNSERLTPNWVGWVLTAAHTDGSFERKGHKFMEDQEVPAPRATYADIREGECGYQRGHICPAGDNKWSYQAQKEAFLMTNICPQNGDLNQRDWKYLEEACRDWAKRYGKVYIVRDLSSVHAVPRKWARMGCLSPTPSLKWCSDWGKGLLARRPSVLSMRTARATTRWRIMCALLTKWRRPLDWISSINWTTRRKRRWSRKRIWQTGREASEERPAANKNQRGVLSHLRCDYNLQRMVQNTPLIYSNDYCGFQFTYFTVLV